jgi:hypothetical protein
MQTSIKNKKIPFILSALFLAFGVQSYAQSSATIKDLFFVDASKFSTPHYDLEMSSKEYQKVLAQNPSLIIMNTTGVQNLIELGERNLKWLDFMNAKRDAQNKIRLTRPGDLKGIPIEKPSTYNEQLVKERYEDWLKQAPVEMIDILVKNKAFTENPPVDMDVYIDNAKKVDKIYQTAARWLTMQPYLSQLAARAWQDVRGYYFLGKEINLTTQLQNWSQLTQDKQNILTEWLVNLCLNSRSLSYANCKRDLNTNISNNKAIDFFNKYNPYGARIWNSLFNLPVKRTDIVWTNKNPEVLWIPFLKPTSSAIFSFIKDNIEDEWRTSTWNLKLNFLTSGNPNNVPHVEFEPGVTPHVNGLGGNTITMDANLALEEWDNQWTIRHEFGHVIGFPDCYIEFYDNQKGVIINYQLDISNMMCSRAGKFLPTHFDELKRVHFPTN